MPAGSLLLPGRYAPNNRGFMKEKEYRYKGCIIKRDPEADVWLIYIALRNKEKMHTGLFADTLKECRTLIDQQYFQSLS